MKTVGVVIPYYQRDTELVLKALDSIASQELPPETSVRIFIVDDASPVPLTTALALLPPDYPHPIIAITQENGGPGAARNRGLEAAQEHKVDYIAFLDSDDFWYPGHLLSALSMLDEGSTFYFSNTLDDPFDWLHYTKYAARHHSRTEDGYRPLERVVPADEFLLALFEENVTQTSQVVYDFRRHANVRFDPTYRNAGEDHAFWIDLTKQADQVAYSTVIYGARGHGVSMYRSTLSWDVETASGRLVDQMTFWKRSLDRFGKGREGREILKSNLTLREMAVLFIAARGSVRAPLQSLRLLARALQANPGMALRCPQLLLAMPGYYRDLKAGRVVI
jgi:succinoglycan biosynthesis protein ExoW